MERGAPEDGAHLNRLYLAAALVVALPLIAALLPHSIETDRMRHLHVGYALAGLPYLYLLCRWRSFRVDRRGFWILLGAAAAARLALVSLPPLLSEDVWRYVWDGLMQHAGMDPYAYPPNSPALDGLLPDAEHIRSQIGHAYVPTIYPPAAQGLFWLTGGFGTTATPLRIALALMDVGTCAGLWLWAQRTGRSPALAWLYAFAPVPLLESSVGSHIDALGVMGMVGAGALLVQGPLRAGALWAIGIGTKLLPLVAAPALLRRPRALVAGGVALGAMYWAYWSPNLFGGLQTYGHRWRANDGLFALLVEGYARIWPDRGDPVEFGTTATTLIRRMVGPNESGIADVIWPDEIAFAAAKLTAIAILGMVGLIALIRRPTYRNLLSAGICTLLVVSPVVHPWYLMWALPLAALGIADGRRWAYAFAIWGVLSWVAYLPRPDYIEYGVWTDSAWWRIAEYLPVWLALFLAVPWRSILRRPSAEARAEP